MRVSHEDQDYIQALNSDTVGLWAYTLSILTNRQDRDELLHATGDNAQRLLNLFQYLLSHTHLGGQARNRVLRALIKLSSSSGCYPKEIPSLPFRLSDFPLEPEGQGRFSVVYRLKLSVNDVREVAAKMIILRQNSEPQIQDFRRV
jgi:hypothetical protein